MSRHSKNNTASSVFTYAERAKLDYGTQKQRLGSDSLRKFDACFLCLTVARDPVCWYLHIYPTLSSKGHLACKECFLSNILAQKKEILSTEKTIESKLKQSKVLVNLSPKDQKQRIEHEKQLEEMSQFEQSQSLAPQLPQINKPAKQYTNKLNSFWVCLN
jgi:nitric oxide synthase-interacting protein